jgi:hypothetical protein
MLPDIRVVPRNGSAKLDSMARVDFGRLYTVEHNVKVFDFGQVHSENLGRLRENFIVTGTCGDDDRSLIHRLLGVLGEDENVKDEEEDEDEEEEEEDEEEHSADGKLGRPSV